MGLLTFTLTFSKHYTLFMNLYLTMSNLPETIRKISSNNILLLIVN